MTKLGKQIMKHHVRIDTSMRDPRDWHLFIAIDDYNDTVPEEDQIIFQISSAFRKLFIFPNRAAEAKWVQDAYKHFLKQ